MALFRGMFSRRKRGLFYCPATNARFSLRLTEWVGRAILPSEGLVEMKICVISEGLSSPLDEGFKKFAFGLMRALSQEHEVLGMSRRGLMVDGYTVHGVRMNRLLLNGGLWRRIRRFSPQAICYVPSSSATFNSYLRARILKWSWPGARVVLVSLQPRNLSAAMARWARRLGPDVVVTQSQDAARALVERGLTARAMPSGVDLETFTPVSADRKQELRHRYGLPSGCFLTLHVGHINVHRAVHLLGDVQAEPGVQVLLVASTSTPQDEHLVAGLEKVGVRIWRRYLPRIHEIYQLADCYLFPVSSPTAAIELPLSVLEAMACNLPVVTTRYGALGDLFQPGDGLVFAATPEEFRSAISLVKKGLPIRTRAMVESYSWDRVVRDHWRSLLS